MAKQQRMLDVGKAIRIVREAKNMRQGILAIRSRVSTPFLCLVETGDRQPSLAVLRRIAGGLLIPAEVLIMLSQPTGGRLHVKDAHTRTLITMIRKMFAVEESLRIALR